MPHMICPTCAKTHYRLTFENYVYKDEKGFYCSWHCYNHRNDGKPNKGRKIKKLELYSKGGYLLKAFTSATDAAEKTGYNASQIRDACREQKPYMGFIWKYRE